jgi:hypothetical protein
MKERDGDGQRLAGMGQAMAGSESYNTSSHSAGANEVVGR